MDLEKGNIYESSETIKNVGTKTGITALHWASQKGYTKIVGRLLENDADPNLLDNNGNTALYIASFRCHKKIVELLKEVWVK